MKYLLACITSFMISCSVCTANIVIGTSAYDPPFEMATGDKSGFFGFEIDLMNEICNRLNDTCQYKPFVFEKLFKELSAGKIDIALSGITITEERQLTWIFSIPYLASKAGLITKSNTNINSFDDVRGKNIGIEAGTIFKTFGDSTFPGATIKEYHTQYELLQAIGNDDVDIIILDYESAQYWINNNNLLFKLVGSGINLGTGYGIMANPDKSDLINRINNALNAMQNDGTYLSIYNRYF